jgi:hypothetical protein
MHRDCAQEAIEIESLCQIEGKARGRSRRVHKDANYAELREALKIWMSSFWGLDTGVNVIKDNAFPYKN